MTTITIHNVETGEIVERDMNATELAQTKADAKKAEAEAQTEATKVLAKAALLEKLGITSDEASLLLS